MVGVLFLCLRKLFLFLPVSVILICCMACAIRSNRKEQLMKGRVESDLGEVVINPDVIATYAGSVAVECFGIVGMAAVNMKDGLVKLLKKDSLKHGINVDIQDNNISLEFHVIVAYGVSISTVAQNLIESVKYKLEEFTGMKVVKVRILVEGVRVID